MDMRTYSPCKPAIVNMAALDIAIKSDIENIDNVDAFVSESEEEVVELLRRDHDFYE